ncbi:MAG: hypothetical protein Q8P86_01525 [bacterium]|nr:hypothetical protein [bacterium]
MSKNLLIGFIGQGYIGRNYADDFERRGYSVTRYALEPEYSANKEKIKECDIVFIAVPTPTVPAEALRKGADVPADLSAKALASEEASREGGRLSVKFDDSILRDVVPLVGKGKIAVIKSTILPGTTMSIQRENPDVIVLNSPEFLSEATADKDTGMPFMNIVGMPEDSPSFRSAAERAHSVLPKAPFSLTCKSIEAEIIKYAHNGSGYTQIIFFNAMYDIARKLGADWEPIEKAILNDPLVCGRYAKPVHKSGRGAGGNCFIKDFAALSKFYAENTSDSKGAAFFQAAERKNIELLRSTGKDTGLLKGVYGEDVSNNP